MHGSILNIDCLDMYSFVILLFSCQVIPDFILIAMYVMFRV